MPYQHLTEFCALLLAHCLPDRHRRLAVRRRHLDAGQERRGARPTAAGERDPGAVAGRVRGGASGVESGGQLRGLGGGEAEQRREVL